MTETIKLKVFRASGFDDKGKWVSYEVPFKKNMRVLDAVKYIKDNLDGSLAYRWNCGMGICGSCAMEVNGMPVLTCKTELKQNLLGTRIGPLRAFPPVKDLVPDYAEAMKKETVFRPWFEGKQPAGKFLSMTDEEIKLSRKFRECIECFICSDSCRPFRDGNHAFLGPKSIVKAMAYQHHPRDEFDRSKALAELGIWHCNVTRCCQTNCPQGIPITDKGILPALDASKKK